MSANTVAKPWSASNPSPSFTQRTSETTPPHHASSVRLPPLRIVTSGFARTRSACSWQGQASQSRAVWIARASMPSAPRPEAERAAKARLAASTAARTMTSSGQNVRR